MHDFVPNPNCSSDEDIVWQFKHDGTSAVDGRHEIAIGVQRNNLMLHWDGNTSRVAVVNNLSEYNDQYIDIKFDVLWRSDDTGMFTMTLALPGETTCGAWSTMTTFRPSSCPSLVASLPLSELCSAFADQCVAALTYRTE